MGKMRRLLAAILVTSMLFGTNGVSYAAETIADSASQETAIEETAEAAEEEKEAVEPAGSDQLETTDTITETSADDASQDESEAVEEVSDTESDADNEAADNNAETPESGSSTEAVAEVAYSAGKLEFNGEDYGKDYSVTLTYDAAAEIPADAQLQVTEIEKDKEPEKYEAYLKEANAAVENSVTDARFFDIKIMVGDEEIQPKSAVRVNISYKEAIEVEEKAEVQAVHFDEKKDETVPVDIETNNGDKVDEVEFEAETFSVYAVLYTVDFNYTDHAFSMPGEGSILLSDLAEKLGFYAESETKEFSVQDVVNVTFTNSELVKTEKQEAGDWLLTSLKAFSTEETLTIDMANGDQFVVVVTDAQDGVYEYTIEESAGNAIELGSEYESNWYLLSTLTTDSGATYYYVAPVSLNGATSITGSINSFYNTADINNLTNVQIGNESAAPSWVGVTSHTYQSGDSVTSELIHVSNAADNYYKIVNGDNNNNREAFGNESVLCKYEITSTDSEGVGSIKLGTLPDLKLKTVFKDSSGEEISGSLPSGYKLLISSQRIFRVTISCLSKW